MNRKAIIDKLFSTRQCFKLVCGAGNENLDEVRNLSLVYTLAGAAILDLSANKEVVNAAKDGIETAFKCASLLRKEITLIPFMNVSIGLKGDPHVRKVKIDYSKCVQCGSCIKVCRQEAILKDLSIKKELCIGCGFCEKSCKYEAVYFEHSQADFEKILPECISLGVEMMELHAVSEDEESTWKNWSLLNDLVKDNYISMCLDRSLLSNKTLEQRVKKAYMITGERLIIQADGIPMGGEGDSFNTTLQAVACADIVGKLGIPVTVLISGGTNSRTGKLAKQCGVIAQGVSIGSYARKIVRTFTKNKDLKNDSNNLKKAVQIAEKLIHVNIEALRG